MANLPIETLRCRAERKCPSAGHCRRYLDRPSSTSSNQIGITYAAWEARRGDADRCDGFIPINHQSISTTAQGGNP